MTDAFYLRSGDALHATALTRGPWDNRFQHGGPPAALLAGAMARHQDPEQRYALCRLSVELLRPVPIGVMHVQVKMERAGRSVQRLSAALVADGREVLLATGLRIRRAPLDLPLPPAPPPWPDPEGLEDFHFPFFQHEVGYHTAVHIRLAQHQWGSTPVGFWTRPRVPLIAGESTSALERLVILADAQSGMGVPLDPKRYTFVNPDLTVYLEREPQGDWMGFDIRSTANAQGAGLAQSAIRDRQGLVGRSAQSLLVSAR